MTLIAAKAAAVAAWSFDTTSWVDDVGSYDLVEGGSWFTTTLPGVFGNGAFFESADLDSLYQIVPAPSNPWCMSFWIKSSSSNCGIFTWSDASNGNGGANDRAVWFDSGGSIWFYIFDGAVRMMNSFAAYNDGNWHHVVVGWDGSHLRMFIDGVEEVSSGTVACSMGGYWGYGASSYLTFGRNARVASPLDGMLDDPVFMEGYCFEEADAAAVWGGGPAASPKSFALWDAGGAGNVEVTPASIDVTSSAVLGGVVLSSVSITPSPIATTSGSQVGGVTSGAVSVTPSPSEIAAQTQGATVQEGGLSITPSSVAGTAATLLGAITQGALALTPTAIAVVSVVQLANVAYGSVSVQPSPSLVAVTTPDPSLMTGGNVEVTPTALEVTTDVSVTVVQGALIITPDTILISSSTLGADVTLGSLSISISSLTVVTDTSASVTLGGNLDVTPLPIAVQVRLYMSSSTIFQGSLNLSPTALAVVTDTLVPIVELSSLIITPLPSEVTVTTIDPAVFGGAGDYVYVGGPQGVSGVSLQGVSLVSIMGVETY